MKNKNFTNLSKKQLKDMAEGYYREILKHKRFYYADEAEIRENFYKGTQSFVDAIEEIFEILRIKHNTVSMIDGAVELEDRPKLPSNEKLYEAITEYIRKAEKEKNSEEAKKSVREK